MGIDNEIHDTRSGVGLSGGCVGLVYKGYRWASFLTEQIDEMEASLGDGHRKGISSWGGLKLISDNGIKSLALLYKGYGQAWDRADLYIL